MDNFNSASNKLVDQRNCNTFGQFSRSHYPTLSSSRCSVRNFFSNSQHGPWVDVINYSKSDQALENIKLHPTLLANATIQHWVQSVVVCLCTRFGRTSCIFRSIIPKIAFLCNPRCGCKGMSVSGFPSPCTACNYLKISREPKYFPVATSLAQFQFYEQKFQNWGNCRAPSQIE